MIDADILPEAWTPFEVVWESWHVLAVAAMGVYVLHFLIQGFLGKVLGKSGDWLALLASGAAAVLGVWTYFETPGVDSIGVWGLTMAQKSHPSYTWFAVEGGLNFQVGILLNATAATMLALVTFITFLVHLFSMEYMKADKRKPRYWAFLSLFAFSMCGIVLANNLFLIFVFWELVGFCSYLLIGFWFEKEKSARSSQKAFIVNRIGDLGFVLGMMVLIAHNFGLQLVSPEFNLPYLPTHMPVPVWAGLFLTMGVIGKSAQFPLQVWLPDAMAGPTPVSSLLHAATMVAAGVYMLLRIEFLYTPAFLTLLAFLGAATALIAALTALTQTDIKGVLAYSTISQLGFMVMAVGVGAQDFAFFHLITHAFFKCGLFLAAGAVIHHIHTAQHGQPVHFDAQDMRLMGGLRRKMPLVTGAYVVFAAALAGLPLFSGFLSKDGILIATIEKAAESGGVFWLVPVVAVLASGLTAFYITRHGLLVFGGKSRMEGSIFERVRRVNWQMAVPLAVLALFSLWVAYSPGNPFHAEAHFGIFSLPYADDPLHLDFLPVVFVAVALIGAGGAWLGWRRGAFNVHGKGPLFKLSFHHYYFDRFYERGIVQPFLRFSAALAWFDKRVVDGAVNATANAVVREGRLFTLSGLSDWMDRNVIDRAVNGVAKTAMALGKRFRKLQSGDLQRYLIYTLLGLLGMLAALMYFT